MGSVLDELVRQCGGCVVMDGGLATQLESHGANINDSLWSALCLITSPNLIRKVHWEYLEAGAKILVSASYQATLQGFRSRGISIEDGESLLRSSVQLACEAREEFWELCRSTENGILFTNNQKALVAASIGSYGAYLADGSEYSGYGPEITLEHLKEFHRRRVQVLADAGADLLAFETIPSKLEAQACIELLEEEDIKIPSWICFSCRDCRKIACGDLFQDCADLANKSEKVAAVGINCSPPQLIQGLIMLAREVTKKHIVVYPNSGEIYDPKSKEWLQSYAACDEDFASYAKQWYHAGATLIGGCCRTTPQTVMAIRRAIDEDILKAGTL